MDSDLQIFVPEEAEVKSVEISGLSGDLLRRFRLPTEGTYVSPVVLRRKGSDGGGVARQQQDLKDQLVASFPVRVVSSSLQAFKALEGFGEKTSSSSSSSFSSNEPSQRLASATTLPPATYDVVRRGEVLFYNGQAHLKLETKKKKKPDPSVGGEANVPLASMSTASTPTDVDASPPVSLPDGLREEVEQSSLHRASPKPSKEDLQEEKRKVSSVSEDRIQEESILHQTASLQALSSRDERAMDPSSYRDLQAYMSNEVEVQSSPAVDAREASGVSFSDRSQEESASFLGSAASPQPSKEQVLQEEQQNPRLRSRRCPHTQVCLHTKPYVKLTPIPQEMLGLKLNLA